MSWELLASTPQKPSSVLTQPLVEKLVTRVATLRVRQAIVNYSSFARSVAAQVSRDETGFCHTSLWLVESQSLKCDGASKDQVRN